MSTIVRHVAVTAPLEKAAEIERLWKQERAPLMIKEAGCIQEELLHSRETPGEYICSWVRPWRLDALMDLACREPSRRSRPWRFADSGRTPRWYRRGQSSQSLQGRHIPG